jgi:hypothetical protein
MRAVVRAGKRPISVDELVRLQHLVIEENRFIKRGLRDAGGFIGDRDWNDDPLPEFVSARHEDIPQLLEGIIAAGDRMAARVSMPASGLRHGVCLRIRPSFRGRQRSPPSVPDT